MTCKTVECTLETPVDFDRIEKTAGYYSDGKFFVEIYKHGTCVFPRVLPGEGTEIREAVSITCADYLKLERAYH